jgi:hypothetical protein
MKILFICGSLEPGKDGVGDYARLFSLELIKQGHEAALISLNDHFTATTLISALNPGSPDSILRLSATAQWDDRIKEAKKFIEDFKPVWLSLQYVSFAFNDKGLPFNLAKKIKLLTCNAKWHIMFHELRVGMDTESPFKHKVWGKVQEIILVNMLRVLKPSVITTQTQFYQLYLDKLGYKASLLPLFGNIVKINETVNHVENIVRIAVFGGIHFGAKINEFARWLKGTNRVQFHVDFIGSNGVEQEIWIQALTKNNIPYTLHGWLKDNEVSNALSNCKWALTSTPFYLVQKSGSVSAMIEHSLLVLCIARDWVPSSIDTKKLDDTTAVNWNSDLDINYILDNASTPKIHKLESVVAGFINHLK